MWESNRDLTSYVLRASKLDSRIPANAYCYAGDEFMHIYRILVPKMERCSY